MRRISIAVLAATTVLAGLAGGHASAATANETTTAQPTVLPGLGGDTMIVSSDGRSTVGGYAATPDGVRHAVLWQDGQLVELTSRQTTSTVLQVNRSGEALVSQGEPGARSYWRWSDGELSPVSAPAGTVLEVRGFSDRGDVLFHSRDDQRAYVVDDDNRVRPVTVQDSDVDGDVTVINAVTMNSRGQVAGQVTYDDGVPAPGCELQTTTVKTVPFVWSRGQVLRVMDPPPVEEVPVTPLVKGFNRRGDVLVRLELACSEEGDNVQAPHLLWSIQDTSDAGSWIVASLGERSVVYGLVDQNDNYAVLEDGEQKLLVLPDGQPFLPLAVNRDRIVGLPLYNQKLHLWDDGDLIELLAPEGFSVNFSASFGRSGQIYGATRMALPPSSDPQAPLFRHAAVMWDVS